MNYIVEAQFVMGVPVFALYPEVDSEETVLIQGIIDAYFEENGELILLDYKTDHVSKQDGADILKNVTSGSWMIISRHWSRCFRKSPSEIDLLICIKVLD